MITHAEIKELIGLMGFRLQPGSDEIYYKNYPMHNDYVIKADFVKEKIDYGSKIEKGDLTTSNFESSENFVVLECVNRLLEKGYSPKSISLEHKWLMGRREKGKLDILVKDKDNVTFQMIECKTWGYEYEREKRKTLINGGQIFSYFQQDKAAQYLCLYSSRNNDGEIEFINDIIKVEPQFRELNTAKEVFEHWNKNFKDNGIFEGWAKPYGIEVRALTRGRLKELKEEDSKRIYNQFAEILRHNIVSDKPNAFNKIFNLFLCKIVDEDRNPDEELQFQWLDDDTDEKLQKRLNDLYKKGMKEYLTKEVTDYSDKELGEKLYAFNSEIVEQIKEMFTKVRLYKNNEFAFKEVYDEKSFKENAVVVREVVELLQPYQIRYTHKHQFLGDFFELLLNTGLKQEAGQYFTPVPIAKFIVSCLPLREMINKKLENKESYFLPYIIDYAVGSGHFLTETMDEVQNIINSMNPDLHRPSVRSRLRSWLDNPFEWAFDYVYGIEADYRLVKTAKVSCFLNGDGLANVIHANGLDNFEISNEYKGKLKEVSKENPKDNMSFDVLVANPPYSVSAFKNTLKDGEKTFDLYPYLTDDSSEIECLFIERAKQLLKVGGLAGIILPSTILNNSGIYTQAREILLKYFNIKAIVEFGSNTFMATGISTISVFLERKANNDWKKIEQVIKNFFVSSVDIKLNNISNAFETYVRSVYDDISLNDYVSFINKEPNENILKEELFISYKEWFNNLTEIKQLKAKVYFKKLSKSEQKEELDKLFFEKVFSKEQEKMLYFFLIYQQKTVIVKVGEKQAEKDFLGYEFSTRRGQEGIKLYKDANGKHSTKLYDDEGNLIREKANYYIYNSFLNQYDADVHEDLNEHIQIPNLKNMLDFRKINFEKVISLNSEVNTDYYSIWNYNQLKTLGEVSTIQKGTSITKADTIDGSVPVIAGGQEPAYYHNITNRDGNIVTVSASGAYAGFVNYFEEPIFASDCNTIQSINEEIIPTKLIYYYLKYIQNTIYSFQRGQAQSHVYADDLRKIKIPIISEGLQTKLLDELKSIDKGATLSKKKIERLKNDITILLEPSFLSSPKDKLGNVAVLERGKFTYRPRNAPHLYRNGIYPFIQTGDITEAKGGKIKYSQTLNEEGLKVSRMFEPETILITIVGANVGTTAILDYSACFPDSIISIRPKENMNIRYLEFFLRTQKTYLSQIAPQSAQANLNLEILKPIMVPSPSIDVQNQIIYQVIEIERKINDLSSSITTLDENKAKIIRKYLDK